MFCSSTENAPPINQRRTLQLSKDSSAGFGFTLQVSKSGGEPGTEGRSCTCVLVVRFFSDINFTWISIAGSFSAPPPPQKKKKQGLKNSRSTRFSIKLTRILIGSRLVCTQCEPLFFSSIDVRNCPAIRCSGVHDFCSQCRRGWTSLHGRTQTR